MSSHHNRKLLESRNMSLRVDELAAREGNHPTSGLKSTDCSAHRCYAASVLVWLSCLFRCLH